MATRYQILLAVEGVYYSALRPSMRALLPIDLSRTGRSIVAH